MISRIHENILIFVCVGVVFFKRYDMQPKSQTQ